MNTKAILGAAIGFVMLFALGGQKASAKKAAPAIPRSPAQPAQPAEPLTPEQFCENVIGGDYDRSDRSCRLPTGEKVDAARLQAGLIPGWPGGEPVNKLPPPPPGSVFLSPPGWRRARQAEVTREMVQSANAALSLPLGSQVNHGTYLIGVESHYTDHWHKGASVFVR